MSERIVTVIPAERGWSVLTPVFGEGGSWVAGLSEQTVIGWRIETVAVERDGHEELEDSTVPVVLEMDSTFHEGKCALRSPLGRLFIPEMEDFKNDDELIAHFQHWHEIMEGARLSRKADELQRRQ